jgi:cytochrome c biogenesis protein CcmG/thiol:disulfide interchange protein DsbE
VRYSNKHHYFYDIHPDYLKRRFERVYLFSMTESKPRRTLPLLLLGLGFLLIAASGFYIYQDVALQADFSTVPAQVNFAAPELTLTDTQGVERSLADYRGQVVLVNLWATWCPPCKEEMPAFQSFYNKLADKGFTIIAINDGDPEPDVLQFVKDYELTFPIWLDPTYIATEQAFNTLNLPTSFVIDRNGIIRLTWVGGINRKMLDKHVTPLITEE